MTTPTTADFVGLADTIYNRTDLTNGSSLQINNTKYTVLDVINHSSSDGYYGVVLRDNSTNTLFVVDRGTDPKNWRDVATDIVMAGTDQNLQWQDADALAQFASQYASSHGSIVYTVGHSLGGTLAQMQAAIYGWNGITFNAYGSGEVLNELGYTVDPYQPNITNYRTLFDLVSDSSTQIGNVITLEDSRDNALLATGNPLASPVDLIETIGSDHLLSNFYVNSDPTGSWKGYPTYIASGMFANPTPTESEYMAQLVVYALGRDLATTREIIADVTTYSKALVGDVLGWISGNSQPGETAVIPADSYLLQNALNPSAAYNIYRAALIAGSSVVLEGIDPSAVQDDTLWAPGQTSGLTVDYLVARNEMIQAGLQMDAGSTVTARDSGTHVYTDLNRSPDPLYTLIGTGEDIYDTEFGDDKGDVLQVSPEAHAELYGGAGNDTLFGGPVSSTLQGAAGSDEYVIDGSGSGIDRILDTDGQGTLEWQFADGTTEVLSGGMAVAGTLDWKSADGKISYFQESLVDGTTTLGIQASNKTVFVDDFTNGEFGITLQSGPPSASNGLQVTSANSHASGSSGYGDGPEFVNDGSLTPIAASLVGPNDTSGQFWQIDGAGNATSIFGGTGNEWIAANINAFVTSREVDATPVYIQAGSGAQVIIGNQGADTLLGGSDTLSSITVTFAAGDGPNPAETSAYTVAGSQGFDWIAGDGGDNLIEAGSGSALIFGGTGSDTIIGGGGNDSIFAGQSDCPFAENYYVVNDYDPTGVQDGIWIGTVLDQGLYSASAVIGSSNPNLIVAGTGNDLIYGSLGDDTIYGGSGIDTIVGSNGNKRIYGGSGGGVIYADENYWLEMNAEQGDTLFSADWRDAGASYSDTIYGGSGDTTIYGSGGADYIYAGGGNDVINVGDGNSFVFADGGNVTMNGGTGDEIIDGGTGDDLINVGQGNTYVYAGLGTSTINAGAGNDTIEAGGGNDTLVGSTGAVTYVIGTNTGADTIELGSGPTTIQLVDGLDETNIVVRHVNSDLVLTDPVSDTQVTILGYFNGVSNLALSFQDGTIWNASQILQATMAPSNGGEDTLVGTSGNDSITAGVGDTLIVDSTGDNTLTGGYGSDTIEGGSDADTIEGGPGTTQMVGGTGLETYIFNFGDGSSTISESSESAGNDVFSYGAGIAASNVSFGRYGTDGLLMAITDPNTGAASTVVVQHYFSSATGVHQVSQIKFADGTSLDKQAVTDLTDSFYGDGTDGELVTSTLASATYYAGEGANVTVEGGSGNDMIYGGSNSDTLLGEAGNDTISDGIGADSISGGDGNNLFTIVGDQLVDTVTGGSGNDTFDVQGASELLAGGGGSNTYVIDSLDLVPPADGISRPDIIISDATASDTLNLVDVSSEGELSAALSGNDLVLTVGGSLDVTLKNITSGLTAPSVILSDGTTLDGAALYTMAGGDDAPQVNGTVPDLSATEGLGFQWTLPSGFFSDPDPNDGIASISASLIDSFGNVQPLPQWLQFDATNGSFSGTPPQTDVGAQYTIQLTATDTHGATSSTQFHLSVVSDRAPVATGVEPDQNLAGGQPFSIAVNQVQFSDPDIGDALSYKAVAFDSNGNSIALPSWISFDPSTLTFSGTVPSFVDATSYKLGIEATDLQGLSVNSVFGINLSNVDVPPHQGSAWESDVYDSQNQTLDLDVSSWVAGQGALTWTVSAPDGSPLPAWLHFDPTTHVFSASLTQATVGDTAIELTVSDSAGGTFSGTFSLHVQDVPDAPVATATPPDIDASVGQSMSWTVPNGLFTDPDPGDQAALEYGVQVTPDLADLSPPATWANLASWLTYDPANNTLAGTVPSAAFGSYTVNVTATDPTGLSASTSFHIGISNTTISSVYGTANGDTLKGNRSTPSLVDGEGGNDQITGGSKVTNWLLGGAGNDTLVGGATNDYLDGGSGADVLQGGAGNDTIRSDTADTIAYSSGDGTDDVGALGTLSLLSKGLTITKMVADYGITNDQGSGYGWRVYLSNGESIALHDYSKPTTLHYDGSVWFGDAVSVLYDGTSTGKDLGTYFQSESDGSDGNDKIYGQSLLIQEYTGADYGHYSNTNDTIYGNGGDDTIMSGLGADSIDGGDGNDLLYGGAGSDILIGGAGNDTLSGNGGWNETTTNGASDPGNDELIGGDGNDTYLIDALPDSFSWEPDPGNDTISDSSGNDQIIFAQDDGVTDADVGVSGTTMVIRDNYGKITFDTTEIESVVLSDGTIIVPSQWASQAAANNMSGTNESPSSTTLFRRDVRLSARSFAQISSKSFDAEIPSELGRAQVLTSGSASCLAAIPALVAGNSGAMGSPEGEPINSGSNTISFDGLIEDGKRVSTEALFRQGEQWPDDPIPAIASGRSSRPSILRSAGRGGSAMAGSYGRSPPAAPGLGAAGELSASAAESANTQHSRAADVPPTDKELPAAGDSVSPTNVSQPPPSKMLLEPDEGTKAAIGAPTDILANDPNDVLLDTLFGSTTNPMSTEQGASLGVWGRAVPMRSLARDSVGVRAAYAADSMVKALTAHGGLRLNSSASAAQLQLMDGTVWSLSSLDRALAALTPAAGRASNGLGAADLTHAQLVDAMAAFNPVDSAESAPLLPSSEAYAIALAVQAH